MLILGWVITVICVLLLLAAGVVMLVLARDPHANVLCWTVRRRRDGHELLEPGQVRTVNESLSREFR
jgi:hypothetical protein